MNVFREIRHYLCLKIQSFDSYVWLIFANKWRKSGQTSGQTSCCQLSADYIECNKFVERITDCTVSRFKEWMIGSTAMTVPAIIRPVLVEMNETQVCHQNIRIIGTTTITRRPLLSVLCYIYHTYSHSSLA